VYLQHYTAGGPVYSDGRHRLLNGLTGEAGDTIPACADTATMFTPMTPGRALLWCMGFNGK